MKVFLNFDAYVILFSLYYIIKEIYTCPSSLHVHHQVHVVTKWTHIIFFPLKKKEKESKMEGEYARTQHLVPSLEPLLPRVTNQRPQMHLPM